MKRAITSLFLLLALSIAHLAAQSGPTERQVIVFAADAFGSQAEVTVNQQVATLQDGGTYHRFLVKGSTAFVYVQPTGKIDKTLACGYLATFDSSNTYYLQEYRPPLGGTIMIKHIDADTAKQWLTSLKEQQ